MGSITELWLTSKETLELKTLAQILSFTGDGKLKDGNSTSKEFRELLGLIPSHLIKKFANACLIEKFDDGGLALQDIVNQIGTRLGFNTQHGLYRGKQNDIGFDGIWTSKDGYNLIVEVKTSDAYRINLDTISEYRTKLIGQGRVSNESSSILFIVGRQDTGDLEAQIRGSKHAWDMRIISTDSLLNLLNLKEELNNYKTIQQINELLKPREYTRIDELIDLIFITSKDLQLEEPGQTDDEDRIAILKGSGAKIPKFVAVSFHEECLDKIQKKLKMNFVKQTRIAYSNVKNNTGLICTISKIHMQGKKDKYWFAFRPHQQEYLHEFKIAYVAFGCGSAENTFLIPFLDFEPLIKNLLTTERDDRMYWHVNIIHIGDKFILQQAKNETDNTFDITTYKI
jgi:hypothetical protein